LLRQRAISSGHHVSKISCKTSFGVDTKKKTHTHPMKKRTDSKRSREKRHQRQNNNTKENKGNKGNTPIERELERRKGKK